MLMIIFRNLGLQIGAIGLRPPDSAQNHAIAISESLAIRASSFDVLRARDGIEGQD